MTNKKKHGKSSTAATTTSKAPTPASQKSSSSSVSASLNDIATTQYQPPQQLPKGVFTGAQLTILIFMAMGISRMLEWQRAVYEITHQTDKFQNGTGLCHYYLTMDYNGPACESPVTLTLMTLNSDAALQLVMMAAYLLLQCWHNEPLLDRLNAFLTLAPVATTLLLLRICKQWISQAKSVSLIITCGILMAVAGTATARTLREMQKGHLHPPPPTTRTSNTTSTSAAVTRRRRRGTIQTVLLSSMVFLNLYEMYTWWLTSRVIGHDNNNNNNNRRISVLAVSLLTSSDEPWISAWKVWIYSLVTLKLAVALLLGFVWFCFDEHRQRSFLLCWAIIKGVEYNYQMTDYSADHFQDLKSLKLFVLTSCVFSTMAWMAPSWGFTIPPKKTIDAHKSKSE